VLDHTPTPPLRGRAIRELPETERPRERLALRGPGGLTTAELIALVWGSGIRGRSAVELATDALAAHDGLSGLARATDIELASIPGVGAPKLPSSWPRSSSDGASWRIGRRRAG
jgi:DNA repair protein RadC